jgi:hypothetical protein
LELSRNEGLAPCQEIYVTPFARATIAANAFPFTCAVLLVAWLSLGGHSFYVHYAETEPAATRFNRALRAHDQEAMQRARADEDRALRREDLFWFLVGDDS